MPIRRLLYHFLCQLPAFGHNGCNHAVCHRRRIGRGKQRTSFLPGILQIGCLQIQQLAIGQLLQQGSIFLQHPQRCPSGTNPNRLLCLNGRQKLANSTLQIRIIGNHLWQRHAFRLQLGAKPFQQFLQALFAPGRHTDHRNTQASFQCRQIHGNTFLFPFIQQIDTDQNPSGKLHSLQNQVQIPCQTGNITNKYNRIRLFQAEKVPGNRFLGRMRTQRIRAR